MNSLKTVIIFFAIFLLILVGASLFLGNPEGTSDTLLTGLDEVLTELELNKDEVLTCVNEGTFDEHVRKNVQEATSFGFTGTPASILFDMETGNTAVICGAFPFEFLKEMTDRLLTEEFVEGDILFENNDLNVEVKISRLDVSLSEDDHLRGSNQARIALIEYSDLDCPYCASFHGAVLRFVVEYETEAVWAFRHYPLLQLHPGAARKAAVAECAGNLKGEEAFWAIVDTYYLNSTQ